MNIMLIICPIKKLAKKELSRISLKKGAALFQRLFLP